MTGIFLSRSVKIYPATLQTYPLNHESLCDVYRSARVSTLVYCHSIHRNKSNNYKKQILTFSFEISPDEGKYWPQYELSLSMSIHPAVCHTNVEAGNIPKCVQTSRVARPSKRALHFDWCPTRTQLGTGAPTRSAVELVLCLVPLHWTIPLNHIEAETKWPTFLQTTFPNAFSWMKFFKFQTKFDWNMSHTVELIICQHWFS